MTKWHNFEGMNSIHQFTIENIEGKPLHFSDFKGKKILIVNTASACGFTPQYAGLEELFEAHKEKIVVVGVPANEFGAQEPGSDEEIQAFCTARFGVTFPLAKKQVVKGTGQSPLYEFLTQKANNGVKDVDIKWNFHKIVLDENGILINDFSSNVGPLDEALLKTLGI
jgi:glutathione peroxidase